MNVKNIFGIMPTGADVIEISCAEEPEEEVTDAVQIATARDRKTIERLKKNACKFVKR